MKNKTPTKIYTLPRTPIPRRTSKKEKKMSAARSAERGPQRGEVTQGLAYLSIIELL